MARKAEVVFVGDASSIIRASAEARAAIDGINSSSDKSSTSLGGMSTKMKLLSGAVATAGASLPALVGSIGALGGAGVGIAAVTAGVTVLAAGFKELYDSNKAFAGEANRGLAQLKSMLAQGVQPLLAPAQQVLKQLPSLIKQVAPAMKSLFSGAATLIKPLASGIVTLAKVGLPQLGSVLKASSGLIKPLANGFAQLIKLIGPELSSIIKAMQPLIGPLLRGIGGALSGALSGLSVLLKGMTPAIKPLAAVFVTFGKSLGTIFSALGPAVKASAQVLGSLMNVLGALLPVLARVIDSLANALAPVLTVIAKTVQQLVPIFMPFITAIGTSLGNALKQVAPLLTELITSLVKSLKPELPILLAAFTDLVKLGLNVFVLALKTLTPVLNEAIKVIGFVGQAVADLTKSAVWKQIGNVITTPFRDASNTVKNVVGDVKSWLSNAWADVKTTASNDWSDIRGFISNAIGDAITTVKNVVGDVRKWLAGAWDDIVHGVSTFAGNVVSNITGAFTGAVNAVIGFIDDIIGAIDKIPGVHIGLISKIGGGSSKSSPPGGAGGYAMGGHVTHPMFIVGEEAPAHPEYVIATNPAYRNRNLGLWAQAGHQLGIPGFAQGGIPITGRLNGNPQGTIDPSKITAFGSVGKAISSFIGNLPGVGSLPGWLAGMGSTVLGDAASWIKSKVTSVFNSVVNAIGLGGGGSGHPIGGGGGIMSQPAIEAVWKSAGGPPGIAHLMAAISDAESGGNPRIIQQGQPYATTGWGLWQITPGNSEPQFGIDQAMLNPLNNARAAVAKYNSGGLTQWTTYSSGAYKQFYADGGILRSGGHRSGGGPVSPGYIYRVGEQGPEDFIPNGAGRVMSTVQTGRGAGGGDIINHGTINFTGTRAAKATLDRLAWKAQL